MRELKVAIVGAAGAVGTQLVRLLEERDFPVSELRLMATKRSAGTKVAFRGEELTVEETSLEALRGFDLAFMAVGTEASREMAPVLARQGIVVIDKSNAFRMDPEVPLVVPEVNPHHLKGHRNIIASPNCSTIQMLVALQPIRERAGLRRIIVSTYQSVSGTGVDAMAELREQTRQYLEGRPLTRQVYPHRIAFNCLPHIDVFEPNGYTQEEMKLVRETRKIFGEPDLPVSATAVRVPVFVGHSEAVTVQTERPLSAEEAREVLRRAPGVIVQDDPGNNVYPLATEAAGRDEVFVGRIREDLALENGLSMWVVADNLRKGAATNAVQIAELMLREGMLGQREAVQGIPTV